MAFTPATSIGSGGGGGGGVVDQGARDATVQAWYVDNAPADTLDVILAAALPAGGNNIGDVDVLTLPALAQLPAALVGGRLDVTLGAAPATVTVAEPVSVDDNAGSLTVDAPVATPVAIRLSDGAAFYDAAKTGQLPAALVGGRLDENLGAWLGSTAPTVGQKAMASSVPVALASDQAAIPVSESGTWTVQPGNTQNTTPWKTRDDADGALAAAVPTAAIYGGALAKTANPTAVADGQLVGVLADKYGRQVVAPAPQDLWGQGRVTLTTTTATDVLAAAGASIKWAVTDILVTDTIGTTATRLDILDGATLIHSFSFVETAITAGEPRFYHHQFRVPYVGTANTAVRAQLSVAVTDVRVVVTGFKVL